jgi:hypothetical protein
MRSFMDEFDVVPGRTGGAEIIMSKKLPSANGRPSNDNDEGDHNATSHQA